MLYVENPARADSDRIGMVHATACVSQRLPSTAPTQEAQGDRIAPNNRAGGAFERLRSQGPDRAEAAAFAVVLASGARAPGLRREGIPGGGILRGA